MSTILERPTRDRSRVRQVDLPTQPGSDRRFIITFFAALGSMLLAIAGAAFVVDARGFFGVGIFEPLILPDRDWKAAAFTRLPQPPNTLILGSSRSFKLEPACIAENGGGRTFNFAVSSARAEDYLAVLRFALATNGDSLRRIIIGVDELAFMPRRGPNRPLRDSRSLRRYAPAGYGREPGDLGSLLLSVEAVRNTTRSIRHTLDRERSDRFEFGPDGFLVATPWDGLRRRGEYDPAKELARSIAAFRAQFQRYTQLGPELVAYFTELVNLAHARGIRIDAFLTPLHPAIVAAAEGTHAAARITEVRALLRGLEARGLLHFHDTADLASIGGVADDFYDGVHMTGANAPRLLAHILGMGDACAVQ